MGNSSCCHPKSIDSTLAVEVTKPSQVIKSNRKEKTEITVCITTSTIIKNTSENTNSVCDIKEESERKKKTTQDILSPKKQNRKDIEVINDIFNEEQLNKLKAYLFKEKFLFEEMNDSTR